MPPEHPKMASPADLARIRPRLATPRTPQPPSRRAAGPKPSDKAQARRGLRALVGDPATDFAAMSVEQFSAALRCAREDRVPAAPLIAEAARRITEGSAASADLHQVLFPPGHRRPRVPADDAWASARTAAMAAIEASLPLAVQVLAMQAVRLGFPGIQYTESQVEGGFRAAASLSYRGEVVTGATRGGVNKKTARQKAALSLLHQLMGDAATASGDGSAGVPPGPVAGSPTRPLAGT